MEKSIFKALSAILSTKAGKLIAVVVLAGLMATSSAAVFVNYYGTITATVQTNDEVTLSAGADNIGGSVYPTASVSATGGVATIGLSLFKDATTYFTDLLHINNVDTANAHDIIGASVTVTSKTALVGTSGNDGTITIYLYAEADQTNSPSTEDCIAYAIIDSSSTLATPIPFTLVSSWPTLATADTADTAIIEVTGIAASDSTQGQTAVFRVDIQWN